MKITEIRVKLMAPPEDRKERLKAFCTVTLGNEFVVRDLKIIDGAKGLFVAMPSRKLMARCPECGQKNPMRASYCNDCGTELDPPVENDDPTLGRRLHADVAHPIHQKAREALESAVLAAFRGEVAASKRSDYRPHRFDDLDYDACAKRREADRRQKPRQAEGGAG